MQGSVLGADRARTSGSRDQPRPGYHEALLWDDVGTNDTVDDLELEVADA